MDLPTLIEHEPYIFSQYLPQSQYRMLTADVLELYDHRFKDEAPDSVIEIWLPVRPER